MTLDEFVADMQKQIQDFADQYRKDHANNPEMYPLDIPDEDSGLWLEGFLCHSSANE